MKCSTLILMLMAVLAGVGLFTLKYEVSDLEDKLAKLRLATKTHHQEIHVLRAEWAYLNRPTRLKDLGSRLLFLEPTKATQTIGIEDIPYLTLPHQKLSKGNTVPPAADRDPPPKITFLRVP